jgi:two-component system sensor histidine kinase BaeS
MRSRLTLVLVLLMAATLLAAGVGTLLVTRRAARNDATRQLLVEATTFAGASNRLQTPRLLRVVDEVLRPEKGRIITITASGNIPTQLPAGLTAAELDPAKLLAGEDVTGMADGSVFAAVPAQLGVRIAAVLPAGTRVAVLLTRQVGALGPSWLYILLVSGITLVIAAGVAAWLARRITRPLVDASAVTRRIAGGELTARVPARAGEYPELASLGESINSMAERLQGGRERERQLLLSVSHDLRTPLTSIRGYAEAIEDGVTPDVAGAAAVIVSESIRLERLVADLLDLARLGADRLSLHIGPTDVAEIVGRTVDGFRPRAIAAGIALDAVLPPPGLLVTADPDRLGQVLANLVENGLSFAAGVVRVSVVERKEKPAAGGSVYVLVEDDGPGIAPADLERVFDRFYQADRGVAARRGLGLGLAIVAELVRAMGGHVRAESPARAVGGTRMVVELRPWGQGGVQ